MEMKITYHEDIAVVSGQVSLGEFVYSVPKILAEEVERQQSRLKHALRELEDRDQTVRGAYILLQDREIKIEMLERLIAELRP